MNLSKNALVVAGTLGALVACDRYPTGPDSLMASFDAVDPVVATFSASQGLPGGPFGQNGGPPFMGGMPFGGAPLGATDGHGPGAALPDSLKMSDAQKAQIEALVTAFQTANKADLDAMKAAMDAARAAKRAGKSHEEVKAILDAAKPAADRVHAKGNALRAAIDNVLTAAQRAWLAAHKPDHPPRTP